MGEILGVEERHYGNEKSINYGIGGTGVSFWLWAAQPGVVRNFLNASSSSSEKMVKVPPHVHIL